MIKTKSLHSSPAVSRPLGRRVLCVAIAQAIFGLSSAYGATIDVDNDSDVSSQGVCILRDAIISANTDQATGGCVAGSGVDTITFNGLTTPATINLTNGELLISTPMILNGPGQDQLTLDAGGLSHVLKLNNGSFETNIDVAVDGLTFTNGSGGEFAKGGGISVAHENLILTNSTISNSSSNESGGGLYAGRRSTVSITGSVFTGNTARFGGGGIDSSGLMSVYDSTISGNLLTSGSGAGIGAFDGHLTLVGSTISGNTAQGVSRDGGGLQCFFAEVDIIDSQITSNVAPTGGGIFAGHACTMSITNSTIANNVVPGSDSRNRGGGIAANSNGQSGDSRFTITVTNSTISGNSAHELGGVYAAGGVLYLNQVTIANNTAIEGNAPEPPNGNLTGPVGGLQVDENIHLSNSIIANNTGADCNDVFEPLATNINNMVGDGTCSASKTGDPMLGSLENNGGLTDTHNLLAGSQAFGAGDPNYCPETDQRGVKRPDGSYCDLGAVESAIVVTTLADERVDDGFCSLREAVRAAQTNAPYFGCAAGSLAVADSILFAGVILPGTITMSGSHITVQSSVDILGPGSERLSISGNDASRVFRVTDYSTAAMQNVAIGDLTLTGGSAFLGGAISNYEILTIRSSVLTGNTAANSGGAIFNEGDLTITASTLSGNTAGSRGGALYNQRTSATITNSVVSNNQAGLGGGIGNTGSLRIVESTLSGNVGSGLLNFADASVIDSTIAGNTGSYGAGVRISSSAGLFVQNSTISGNTASPGFGGGIGHQGSGTLTVINSTVSGNSATRGGGGISSTGSAAIELLNATLSNNSAAGDGGGGFLQKYGGDLSIINTVIANSQASNECALLGGVFSAHINNLIEDGSCDVPSAVNLITGDPVLGPLQFNGGLTQTHALLPGSPLIDAGDANACSPYPADQRGFLRPEDGDDDGNAICDIGSFEVRGMLIFRSSFESPGK